MSSLGGRGPRERWVLPAVGWLVGPDLVARFSRIVRKRHDPRTWMSPPAGRLHVEHAGDGGRLGLPGENAAGGVWFDFAADTGDSGDAMYAVATACLADLDYAGDLDSLETLPDGGAPLKLWRAGDRTDERPRGSLPRGQFLFLGGDTAYHVADHATIRNRFQSPFRWAWDDLAEDVAPSGQRSAATRLYGIPGNHDWYDNLSGFSRLIETPLAGAEDERIAISGFEPVQQASYLAIGLPYGWQLWGLDIDSSLDAKQMAYFRGLCNDPSSRGSGSGSAPERLILCTPSPPIVFDAVLPPTEHRSALDRLCLPQRYDDDPGPGVRLDLAGDIHQYVRYQTSNHYAAVVSGLGGAFHHPTFTRKGAKRRAAVYPSEKRSIEAIAAPLLSFVTFLRGSWLFLLPAFLTLFLAFVAHSDLEARALLSAVDPLRGQTDSLRDAIAGIGESLFFLLLLTVAATFVVAAWLNFQRVERVYEKAPEKKLSAIEALLHKPSALLSFDRSHWPSAAMVAFGAGLFVGVRFFVHGPTFGRALVNSTVFLALCGFPLGGALAAALYGAKRLPAFRKLAIAVMGFMHGTAQILTPLAFARFAGSGFRGDLASQAILGSMVVVGTWVMLRISRYLFRLAHPWLASGLVCLLALVSWLGVLTVLLMSCSRFGWGWDEEPSAVLRHILAALLAACVCTSYLGWYFAAVGRMGGHNNEVGAAAGVTSFRQIIRFHLNEHRLRGYVIAIENGSPAGSTRGSSILDWLLGAPRSCAKREVKLEFKIVDVFSLKTSMPPNPPPPPSAES